MLGLTKAEKQLEECNASAHSIFPREFSKFRETLVFESVFLEPLIEMDVFIRVIIFVMILLAPLATADRDEVPVVREFHEAMMNRNHSQSLQNFISLHRFCFSTVNFII